MKEKVNRAAYSLEYKLEAVRLVTGGQAKSVTAKVMGITTADFGQLASLVSPVIPPRSNRLTPRDFDRARYKARNFVERFFCRLKQFRRLATRYDKLACRFNAFLYLACAYIFWLL